MRVTKLYLYVLAFDPGSAEFRNASSMESLRQAVWRAQRIPGHRITIETHNDLLDSREVGMAVRRHEALRRHFLAEGVGERRLEMKVHGVNCCREAPGQFARRAEIRLFPQVPSLASDVGDQLLSYDELSVLESARLTVLLHEDERCRQVEGQYRKDDWRRIVGYESLKSWAAAGGRHPLYDHH